MSQGDLTVVAVGRSGDRPHNDGGRETDPTTEVSKPGGRSSGREGEAPAGRAKLLLSRYLGKTRLSRSFALPKHGLEK